MAPVRGSRRINKRFPASTPMKYKASARATQQRSTMRAAGANARTAGFIHLEKKFVDNRVDEQAMATTWANQTLNPAPLTVSAVAQGDGESNRDGRVYYIHEIYIKGTLKAVHQEGASNPLSDIVARVALVLDKQTNAAELTAPLVFLPISIGDDIDSYRNLQYVQRFDVLKDKRLRLTRSNSSTQEGTNLFNSAATTLPFTMSHKFKVPLKVTCVGTTAAVASIADNSIHVIGCTDEAGVEISYQSRLRFTG